MESNDRASNDVTVLLPVFNGAATINDQLTALSGQITSFDFDVLVVDNGSTDRTPEIVDDYVERDARFRRIVASDQHNLSYVRNVGVRATAATNVLFCDDDDVVAPGWVEAMSTALGAHRFVASSFEYDLLNDAAVMLGRTRFQSEGLDRLFGYAVAGGAGFGVRRDVWLRLGGNDEGLGVAGEDYDFAIRAARECGVEPHFVDGAVVHYRLRTGARLTWKQARRYGRSHVALYRRYGRDRTDRRAELRDAANDWWWILTRSPLLIRGDRRVRWARKAGMRAGRLLGSLAERTLYL